MSFSPFEDTTAWGAASKPEEEETDIVSVAMKKEHTLRYDIPFQSKTGVLRLGNCREITAAQEDLRGD